MMKNIFAKTFTLISALLLVACQNSLKNPSSESRSSDALIMSTLWLQKAPEAKWVLEQSYALAKDKLLENKALYQLDSQLAVVLDLDETVLDNSPYEARLVKNAGTFSADSWSAWVEEAEAELIPGAKSFLHFADSLGIEIFYISNRSVDNLGATLINMQAHGLPQADSSHLFLKTDSSDKTARRTAANKKAKIILLIGDQLGDFSETIEPAQRDSMLQHFILLPNPMYGSFSRLADSVKSASENEKLAWYRSVLNSKN